MVKKVKLSVTINGEEFAAPRPKMKLLKQVMRFNIRYNSGEIKLDTPDGIDEFFQLVVDIIGNEDLTAAELEDMEIAEFSSAFTLEKINDWINQEFAQKKVLEASQVATMKERQKSSTPK